MQGLQTGTVRQLNRPPPATDGLRTLQLSVHSSRIHDSIGNEECQEPAYGTGVAGSEVGGTGRGMSCGASLQMQMQGREVRHKDLTLDLSRARIITYA